MGSWVSIDFFKDEKYNWNLCIVLLCWLISLDQFIIQHSFNQFKQFNNTENFSVAWQAEVSRGFATAGMYRWHYSKTAKTPCLINKHKNKNAIDFLIFFISSLLYIKGFPTFQHFSLTNWILTHTMSCVNTPLKDLPVNLYTFSLINEAIWSSQ